MFRAYEMLWRAWVARYGLALGAVPTVGALVLTAVFQKAREPGLKEVSPVFPQPDKPADPPPEPVAVAGYELATLMTERLPRPPWERLPGVLVRPDGDAFGSAVSAHGLFVAVGAPGDDAAGRDAGAVYLFERGLKERGLDEEKWEFRAQILADPQLKPVARTLNRPQARFGRRVALSNGTLAVMQGSVHHHHADEDAPQAVYVFGSNDGWQSWRQEARLPTPEGGRGHGVALAFLDSHTLLVAAPTATPLVDDGPQGAVYVYHRLSDGQGGWRWGAVGALRPPPGSTGESRFGGLLAAHGNVVAVGTVRTAASVDGDRQSPWTAPLYRRLSLHAPPQDWEYLGALPASRDPKDSFGALALHGPVLAATILRPGYDPAMDPPPAVHVFRAEAEGASAERWRLETILTAPAPWKADRYGSGLAIDAQRLAVAAWNAGLESVTSGVIFFYTHAPDRGWSDARPLAPIGPSITKGFGGHLALAEGTVFTSGSHGPAHPDFADLFLWKP